MISLAEHMKDPGHGKAGLSQSPNLGPGETEEQYLGNRWIYIEKNKYLRKLK